MKVTASVDWLVEHDLSVDLCVTRVVTLMHLPHADLRRKVVRLTVLRVRYQPITELAQINKSKYDNSKDQTTSMFYLSSHQLCTEIIITILAFSPYLAKMARDSKNG